MIHRRTVERVCAWGSALVPAWWAAAHVSVVPVASDVDVLRTVAFADGGQTNLLASLVAAPFVFLPLGSALLRASLASLAVTALAGALLYRFARRLIALRESRTTRLAAPACALGTLTATLSPVWQEAATRPGSALLTPLLVLVALSLPAVPFTRPAWRGTRPAGAGRDLPFGEPTFRWPATLLLALALLLDVGALLLVLAGLVPLLVASIGARRVAAGEPAGSLRKTPSARRRAIVLRTAALLSLGIAGTLGLLLHGLERSALFPLAHFVPLPTELAANFSPGAGQGRAAFVGETVVTAMGWAALALGSVGAALVLLAPRSRIPGLTLTLLFLVASAELALDPAASGASTLSSGASPALLVLVALLGSVLAVALYLGVELVRWSRDGRGLARALFLLLAESTLVVTHAAEASATMSAEPVEDDAWSRDALAPLPPGALVLVSDPAVYRHLARVTALGEGRPDVTAVPLFALGSREGARAWETNPKLLPLFRDFVLVGAPAESTLSALASLQPLFLENALPSQEALVRHQVPSGLFDRYFPESRGSSDRLRALETIPSPLPSLAAPLGSEARSTLVGSLRRRAFSYAALGERETAFRAASDALAFAPDDARTQALLARLALPWKLGPRDDVTALLAEHPAPASPLRP